MGNKLTPEKRQLLRTLVSSGEIDGLVPAEVKAKYATAFASLNPSSFRSALLTLRKQHGEHAPEKRSASTAVSQIPSTNPRLAPKCTAADTADESDTDEFVVPDGNDERRPLYVKATVGGELLIEETRFKPVYQLVEWRDPDDNDNQKSSVVFLLNSGSVQECDLKLKVVDGGNSLLYSLQWPVSFDTVNSLHRKWLAGRGVRKIESYHPRLAAFRALIRRQRGERRAVRQLAKIPLPFTVETRFDTHYLELDKRSTHALYVDLRSPAVQLELDANGEILFDGATVTKQNKRSL